MQPPPANHNSRLVGLNFMIGICQKRELEIIWHHNKQRQSCVSSLAETSIVRSNNKLRFEVLVSDVCVLSNFYFGKRWNELFLRAHLMVNLNEADAIRCNVRISACCNIGINNARLINNIKAVFSPWACSMYLCSRYFNRSGIEGNSDRTVDPLSIDLGYLRSRPALTGYVFFVRRGRMERLFAAV